MSYELNRNDILDFASTITSDTKIKGDELFFRNCPYCHGGRRGDKNTFSINLTTGLFKCFRSGCDKHGHFVELARDFHYQLDFKGQTPARVYRKFPKRTIEVRDPAVAYLASRGIGRKTAERYQITCRKDNSSILVFPFYDDKNELCYIKYRNAKHKPGQGNKEWAEKNGRPILFGMLQCGEGGRLVITEGQIDSLTLAECGVENAVSVPNGQSGFTWLDSCWEFVERFSEVVVFGDCEGGKITLLDTLQKRLSIPVKAVQVEDYLGEKDANDIYRKFGREAILRAVDGARPVPLPYVKELADVESVDIYSLPRIFTNLPEIDRVIGGLYFGQVILLTGKRGEGKSTVASQLILEAIEQNCPVFAYSGELPDYHFKRWLDLQCAGPDNIETRLNRWGDESYYIADGVVERINDWYRGRAYIYDNNAIDGDELEGLLVTVEKAVKRYGIKLVCIDNLMTAMDVGMNEDLYRAQSTFVKELKRLAIKYNIAVLLIAHPRKTKDGSFANDDVSGSGDITNRVDVVMSYSRTTEGSEFDGKLLITKNRLTGKLALQDNAIDLLYSRSTKRISSVGSGKRVYGWEKMKEPEGAAAELPF